MFQKIGYYAFEQCFKKHLLYYASKKMPIMLKIMPLNLANKCNFIAALDH